MFGNTSARKELALKQMVFWDSIEGDRVLFVKEQSLRKQTLEEYQEIGVDGRDLLEVNV